MGQLVVEKAAPLDAPPVVVIDSDPADDVAGIAGPVQQRSRRRSLAVWFFRSLLLIPFVVMAPEIIAYVRGRPDAATHLSGSGADVLGTSSFLLFVMMLTVTPIHTMTGWHWHLVLRRDYGVAMFFVAAMDLLFAALTTGDTFPGGFFDRVGGHTFLVTGTVAVLLLVPLALTATHRAKRWLGRYWKSFHRLTYVIWGLIVLHLLLLFGFRSFARDAVLLSAALALPRIPAVRRWWATSRRAGAHRVARSALVVMLTSVFVVGYAPFVQELIGVGAAAFHQTPVED